MHDEDKGFSVPLEEGGEIRVSLDAEGFTVLIDDDEDYEVAFSPAEFDTLVDHIYEQRALRMH